MKITKESTRMIKPLYEGDLPSTNEFIPLTVFDVATFDTHIAVIYAYRPPTPPNAIIELGLKKVLGEFREWAGRFGQDDEGKRVIVLNDKGVRFVEATMDCTLEQILPFKPSSFLLNLHPSVKNVEDLAQVQLTRFSCGSLVVGFTSHHHVADGHATSNFLVAWGKASRGLDIGPLPLHDRSIFVPRNPPVCKYDHRGVEYIERHKKIEEIYEGGDDIVVHKVHFSVEFLKKLKIEASRGSEKPYSTFETLLAHLWRKITKARGLDACEISKIRISMNGRTRIEPCVPNEYFGNLVLWCFPKTTVNNLVNEPLGFPAKTIHDAVVEVDDDYFKSFIDFSSSKVQEEDLVPTTDMEKAILSPNVDVESWLRFPFHDLDFGGGSAYAFMPSFYPTEGLLFFLPSFSGDRSIDVYVPLFRHHLDVFKEICFEME